MPANKYIEPIFLTFNEGVFRGHELAGDQASVKEAEAKKLKLTEEKPGYLFYEYIFPKDTSEFKALEYAEIKYFFKDDKLDIITATYYLNREEDMDTISALLTRIYDRKYGHSYRDVEKYLVWDASIEAKIGDDIKYDIALKKGKEAYDETKLIIEFLRY